MHLFQHGLRDEVAVLDRPIIGIAVGEGVLKAVLHLRIYTFESSEVIPDLSV